MSAQRHESRKGSMDTIYIWFAIEGGDMRIRKWDFFPFENGVPYARSESAHTAELRGALKELSDMYAHAWDTVNGDLLMMGDSVKRFEKAHDRARAALAVPDGSAAK